MWPLGRPYPWLLWIFVGRVMSCSSHCLCLSWLFRQEAIIFWVHGCSHHPQWIWSPRRGYLSLLPPFPLPSAWINGAGCHGIFLIFSLKPTFSLCSFTLIKRLFSSSSLSAIRMASSTSLRLLMFLPPISILACNSSSPALLMMCSVYRLNKQGDHTQPCRTTFLIFNQLVVPYRALTVASW